MQCTYAMKQLTVHRNQRCTDITSSAGQVQFIIYACEYLPKSKTLFCVIAYMLESVWC